MCYNCPSVVNCRYNQVGNYKKCVARLKTGSSVRNSAANNYLASQLFRDATMRFGVFRLIHIRSESQIIAVPVQGIQC
jgi:hypothetical protein